MALKIPNGAHHIDLRAAGQDDPKEVVEAREMEVTIMQKWIKDYQCHHNIIPSTQNSMQL